MVHIHISGIIILRTLSMEAHQFQGQMQAHIFHLEITFQTISIIVLYPLKIMVVQ